MASDPFLPDIGTGWLAILGGVGGAIATAFGILWSAFLNALGNAREDQKEALKALQANTASQTRLADAIERAGYKLRRNGEE